MENDYWFKQRFERIESQLFHLKVMLAILIAMYLLDFYGLLGISITVVFWITVFVIVAYLIIKLVEFVFIAPKKRKADKKLQEIIDKNRVKQDEENE